MQKVKLPITINPSKEGQRRSDFDGYYPNQILTRLPQEVNEIKNDVQASFSLSVDSQNLVVINGRAIIDVEVICERCMNPFTYTLDSTFCYSPVADLNQIGDLPEVYEPIEYDQFGEVNLLKLVEDELLLALPLICRHEFEHCEVSVSEQTFGEIPTEEEKPNPFAILADLKKK